MFLHRPCASTSQTLDGDLVSWHELRDNEGVLTVTEPQVWVLIGVFAAAMFGMVGIVTTSFNRTLTAAIGGVEDRIGGVRSEINGLRETMNAKFETMDVKFEAMDVKFEAMEAKLSGKFEALDRDIAALSRHVFGTDPH